MIRLSNGYQFEYMAVSGALGFDGRGWLWGRPLKWIGLFDPSLFTVVIKTLTYHPREGNARWYNPLRCVRLIPGGVVNAVGLTNSGFKWWCREIGIWLNRSKVSLVGSIFADNLEELSEMVSIASIFNLVALEINVSCPNISTELLKDAAKVIEICQTAKERTKLPLILKLSIVHNVKEIVPQIEGVIDAISINAVPWQIAFPDRRSPLARFGDGAVSGQLAQPFTWKLVQDLTDISSIPVIGPSVWEFQDIERLRRIGAKAIAFGSIFLRCPWRPTKFVKMDKSAKQQKVE